jgi:hypothetical protein
MADFKAENPDWRSAVILPVYMYEHGNVALRCHDFNDHWDSGQVGWIYALPTAIRKEYSCKLITKKIRAHVTQVLTSEIEEYGRYVNGECYGYTVEDANGEELDACWGFIGWEYAEAQATEAANNCTLVDQP